MVDIAALTLPKSIAPAVAKQLVQYGVSAFWNFAATDLNLPGNIAVENVHLAESLMRLSYNISNLPHKARNGSWTKILLLLLPISYLLLQI